MIVSADVASASERGQSHVQQQTGIEDAVAWERGAGDAFVVVAAVADGHGDRRCFRSAQGARFAVRAGIEAALVWAQQEHPPRDASQLANAVIDRWRGFVDADLAAHAVEETHLAEVARRAVPGSRAAVEDNPRLIYGATLILCVVTSDLVTVVQVGDGDAISVASNGSASRLFPVDPAASPGSTSSLSQPDAVEVARIRSLEHADIPALLLLASDGVGDAYPDDAALLRAGSELLARSRTSGRAAIGGELDAWVSAAAATSGDDASAAVLWLDAEANGKWT